MKLSFIFSSLLFCLCIFPLTVKAAETDLEYEGIFKTIAQPSDFIKTEFHLAKSENKKVIFVLGGNWCHDSRSIAKKLDDNSISKYIEANYRVSMIDVGFLNQGFEFVEKANMQTFYATPTVLIFDPVSENLINASDMHIWANAFKLTQKESNSYFERYIDDKEMAKSPKLSAAQEQLFLKLDIFIEQQELRIKTSYKTIGPLLQRYKDDDIDDNFKPYWEALSDLRMRLPSDIKSLKEKILASPDNKLASITFPEYSSLPWE
jgi:hypothetical protein